MLYLRKIMEYDGPFPEDDLAPGADYVDLTAKLGCEGDALQEMRMHDGALTLRFSSGAALHLSGDDS